MGVQWTLHYYPGSPDRTPFGLDGLGSKVKVLSRTISTLLGTEDASDSGI